MSFLDSDCTASQQRLPTEIILYIFELAIDKDGWKVRDLSQVSKTLRSLLVGRLFRTVHLPSREKLDELVAQKWPGQSHHHQQKFALYLHYLQPASTLDEFHSSIFSSLGQLAYRKQVETLSLRLIPSPTPNAPLGLWTCPLMPNLKRLYIDSTLYPPYGGDGSMAQIVSRVDGAFPPGAGIDPNKVQSKYIGAEWGFTSNLEAYALAGNSRYTVFDHLLQAVTCQSLRPMFLSKLKRLYIFTFPHDAGDEGYVSTMTRDLAELVANATSHLPALKLLVHIILDGPEPKQTCARLGRIVQCHNSTLIIHAFVEDPRGEQE